MLIDGGTSDQSRKMYAVLKKNGIDHLDYIVCSHPHAISYVGDETGEGNQKGCSCGCTGE